MRMRVRDGGEERDNHFDGLLTDSVFFIGLRATATTVI